MNAIQSLRFFAVLMVFLSHLGFLENNDSQLVTGIYKNIFFEGFLGVTFFFILSGFILSHSYGKRMANGDVDYFDYLIARVARIFPTHILTLIIALPLSIDLSTLLNKGLVTLGILGVNAFLLQSFVPKSSVYYSLNWPSWALSDLLFFYILFPFLLALRTWTLPLVSACVIGYQSFVIMYFNAGFYEASGRLPLEHFLIYIFPLSRLMDFIMGMVLYRSFYSKWRLSPVYSTLFQMSAIMVFCAFFAYRHSIPLYYRLDLYYLLPLSLVILSFAYEKGYVAKVMDNKILIYCGSASFAFFMIHQIVIRYYTWVFDNSLLGGRIAAEGIGVGSAVACLIISLLASAGLYKYFEMKAQLKTRFALSKVKTSFIA